MRKKSRKVYGVGVNDYEGSVGGGGHQIKSYRVWKDIVGRCCSDRLKKELPTYRDCRLGEDWVYFSNFKKWYDANYVEGWDLDKDLLIPNNRIYSAETCVFLPRIINGFLECVSTNKKSRLPRGIYKNHDGYRATVKEYGKKVTNIYSEDVSTLLGLIHNKRNEIARKYAEDFKDQLDTRAYNALVNYNDELYSR